MVSCIYIAAAASGKAFACRLSPAVCYIFGKPVGNSPWEEEDGSGIGRRPKPKPNAANMGTDRRTDGRNGLLQLQLQLQKSLANVSSLSCLSWTSGERPRDNKQSPSAIFCRYQRPKGPQLRMKEGEGKERPFDQVRAPRPNEEDRGE